MFVCLIVERTRIGFKNQKDLDVISCESHKSIFIYEQFKMRFIVPRNNSIRQNDEQYRDSLPNPETIPRPNGVGDSVGE